MTFRKSIRVLLCSSAVALLACAAAHAACGGPYNDILERSDPLLAPLQPPDCATVMQTPPDFTWPPQDGDANTYTVTLVFPDGKSEKRTTTRNFLIWPRPLAPGTYRWKVAVTGRYTGESAARTFTVSPAATSFVVPTGEEALERARKARRPRTWSGADNPVPFLKADRPAGLRELVAQVDRARREPLPPEPSSRSQDENYEITIAEAKRAMASALAWNAGRDRAHAADAVRRILNLAAWRPTGAAGYKANDMAGRTIAWTLALGYDWLHDVLDPSQKALVASAVKAHAKPMFDDIGPKLARYPFDSHGNVSLTIAAALAALMAGDLPEADDWLKSTISMAVVWTSPWGREDGGFANGTAQMFWDTQSNLLAWYVYRNAVGVDLAKKPWVRNHGRALAYFVPPGSPSGVFGDGRELALPEVWARVAKAYAAFAPSPLARWYAREMRGEDPARPELLLAPKSEPAPAGLPQNTEHAAHFPSIGWVAMHSDLSDPMRTSVYFKSSPYGSYNHAHSDQNSLVVHHRGQRLAIGSGYYDGYRTPHWTGFYKQTRSANAITFDGGHGQGFNDRRFSGTIARFAHTPSFDYATGRAEKAYAGQLTQAQRTVAYLRPDTIVVYDALASGSPRSWEWNIHAVNRMAAHGPTRVGIANGDATMCVELLAGPPVEFAQTDQFPVAPSDRKARNEWHGTFTAKEKSLRAEFIALMRVGADCAKPSGATATRGEGGWRVAIGDRTVAFEGETASLRPATPSDSSAGAPAPTPPRR